jgi:hypothetical protein
VGGCPGTEGEGALAPAQSSPPPWASVIWTTGPPVWDPKKHEAPPGGAAQAADRRAQRRPLPAGLKYVVSSARETSRTQILLSFLPASSRDGDVSITPCC